VSKAGEPRVAPLPRDAWGDDVRDALQHAFPDNVVQRFLSSGDDALAIPNAITTMLHHPALAGEFLAYNNVLLWSGTLEPRLRELMVLRIAHRTRSEYEWDQHVRLAARYGITAEEAEFVARGAPPGKWTPLESAVLAATDQLIDDYRIADDTWPRLAEHLDERQLVELVFVAGTYTCLAMAFNSFGLVSDAGAGS
jgi:alkylhydroperoxidase family enzyme